jgi:predicted ATP-grasp superfamily ATP-dependent carboligase
MYTGALENHPELIDAMAWLAPLWGNPGDVLQDIRQPWNLRDALQREGLRFPETRSSPEGLPRDGSWLAKTYRGASGSGVRELIQIGRQGDKEARSGGDKSKDKIDQKLSEASSRCSCYQQRVVGTPCAAVFVAADRAAAPLGFTRQIIGESWLGAHGFQYAGSIGPWPINEPMLANVTKIGNVLANRFDLVGLFGVDFIFDGNDLWTLEVNPRYTASVEILERATGFHAIASHVDACVEGRLPEYVQPLSDSLHGKAIVFARRDVTITDAFASWALEQSLVTPWPTLADISPAGTVIDAGHPLLTVFAQSADVAGVERQLRQRVANVEQTLYGESHEAIFTPPAG